jgi:hypothetical protein
MASKTSAESKARSVLLSAIARLQGSIDRLRCDEIIQREGLDFECDRMLDLCDEIRERIPEIVRVA